jgi:hypothetical protein
VPGVLRTHSRLVVNIATHNYSTQLLSTYVFYCNTRWGHGGGRTTGECRPARAGRSGGRQEPVWKVHAVQQVWVRPLVLAGGSTSAVVILADTVYNGDVICGAPAASAYFQDDGGGRDILLGLRGGGAVGSPSRVGRG